MSMIGKTLGNFKCTALIGRGGMGEVYRAKDLKLGRDVAIKVLPEEFAQDTDRVARFQREAKLLATLNHPNIAAIYGLEESDEIHFLVLELVEGVTLEDYIAGNAGVSAGKKAAETAALPELLKLALQITEALEAAHEKGVIHRDLKPANIKITPDNKVKILDFGLAKAFAGDQQEMILSDSPTLSITATEKGVILGTAAYMSPEQARGKSVDKRTDIWAFGCVLYEMLTGQTAFQGEDLTEILASVVRGDANLDLLPADIHWRVREVLNRCLQKDLKKRYRDIGDVHFELEQVLGDSSGALAQPVPMAKSQKKLQLVIPWVAAFFVLGLIIAGVAGWMLRPTEPKRVIRFNYYLPEGQELNYGTWSGHPLAVSSDGRQFIYSTSEGLYLHPEDELEARLIPGTGGDPQSAFFSPDGQTVGYWSKADSKLKRIPIGGGAPVDLCDAGWVYGANWYADNTIVYADVLSGIKRVSANGGTPETLVEGYVTGAQLLPDGKSLLFTDVSSAPYRIVVQSLESGERKELFAGNNARYLPSGHLAYEFEDNIYAVPFNPDTFEVTGGQDVIVEDVFGFSAISDTGTLVYLAGRMPHMPPRTLVWTNREGEEEPLPHVPARNYRQVSISPDGSQVALTVNTNGNLDIWVVDINRGGDGTRLTSDKAADSAPLWTPDGRRIVFSSDREGATGTYWIAADGSGEVEWLTDGGSPYSWADDGDTLITMRSGQGAELKPDIGSFRMEGDSEWKPLLTEDNYGLHPQLSPDGRWLAYMSHESGLSEIYVRRYPEVDKRRWKVSIGGGTRLKWSIDGRELFFQSVGSGTSSMMMAATVQTEPDFSAGMPEALFKVDSYLMDFKTWDISPDGKRFLMIKIPQATDDESATGSSGKISVVVNWIEELKQQVPVP